MSNTDSQQLIVGHWNTVTVVSIDHRGYRLVNAHDDSCVMPAREARKPLAIGDQVDVFVYFDSDQRLAATQSTPLAELGQVAWLKVVSVGPVGAFLDWGLSKDLLLPFAEQQYPLVAGKHCLVKLIADDFGRIAATTYLDAHLSDEAEGLRPGEKVSLIIADKTDLGVKAVVNHRFWGLIYKDQIAQVLRKGQAVTGYIQRIREDGRIDLSLQATGLNKVTSVADQVIDYLASQNGSSPLGDHSSPEQIQRIFGCSKRAFKQAIGWLYKQGIITISDDGIRLVDANAKSD